MQKEIFSNFNRFIRYFTIWLCFISHLAFAQVSQCCQIPSIDLAFFNEDTTRQAAQGVINLLEAVKYFQPDNYPEIIVKTKQELLSNPPSNDLERILHQEINNYLDTVEVAYKEPQAEISEPPCPTSERQGTALLGTNGNCPNIPTDSRGPKRLNVKVTPIGKGECEVFLSPQGEWKWAFADKERYVGYVDVVSNPMKIKMADGSHLFMLEGTAGVFACESALEDSIVDSKPSDSQDESPQDTQEENLDPTPEEQVTKPPSASGTCTTTQQTPHSSQDYSSPIQVNRNGGNSYEEIAEGIEFTPILQSSEINVSKYRYDLENTPYSSISGFAFGPDQWSNLYTPHREFFAIQNSNKLGILWQETQNNEIKLTWLENDLRGYQTITLPSNGDNLVAATNNTSSIFYLTFEPSNELIERPVRLTLHHYVNEIGGKYTFRDLDTSKEQLNMIVSKERFSIGLSSLKYHDGKLGLIISRQMHKAKDGLNHQGAIATVFDAEKLELINNHWRTSSHSLDNFMTVNSDGQFLAVDLGDNYPRGINVHKFDSSNIFSRVVYTFKALHGKNPMSPAGIEYPVYEEISNKEQTFYSWSNDTNTYTEIGSIIEFADGYSVIFVGEPNANGAALDNSQIDGVLTNARNIGVVKIRKDFENSSASGNVVTDDLVLTDSLPQSITEEGNCGFYTFGGVWREQHNSGLIWTTNYQDKNKENASRLKAVKLDEQTILLLWETWSPSSYVETYAMKVSSTGQQLSVPVSLGESVRLHRRDDPIVIDNKVYISTGNGSDRKLSVIVITDIPTTIVETQPQQPINPNPTTSETTMEDFIQENSSQNSFKLSLHKGWNLVFAKVTPQNTVYESEDMLSKQNIPIPEYQKISLRTQSTNLPWFFYADK